MRDAVQKWLESGAEVQAGLRLLSLYAKNEHLAQLVTARPDRYKSLLIDTLCKTAGTSPLTTPPPSSRPAFREQWAFLSEPDCPPELKILAADKITAYRLYHTGRMFCDGRKSYKIFFRKSKNSLRIHILRRASCAARPALDLQGDAGTGDPA